MNNILFLIVCKYICTEAVFQQLMGSLTVKCLRPLHLHDVFLSWFTFTVISIYIIPLKILVAFICKRNIVHTVACEEWLRSGAWGNICSAASFSVEISSVPCGLLGFVVIRVICVNNSWRQPVKFIFTSDISCHMY